MIAASDRLPAYSSVPEPTLLFAGGKLDKHPLRGLVRHGPYSGSIGVPARVRVAAMYPAGFAPKIGGIIQELRSPADPKEATNYYVRYPGFEDAFRVKLEPVLQSQPVSRDYGEMSDAVSACWRISGRPGKLSWKISLTADNAD